MSICTLLLNVVNADYATEPGDWGVYLILRFASPSIPELPRRPCWRSFHVGSDDVAVQLIYQDVLDRLRRLFSNVHKASGAVEGCVTCDGHPCI